MKKPIILLITVVIAGAAFFGGMLFQKSRDSLKGLSGTELTSKMQSLGISQNRGFGVPTDSNMTPPDGNFISGNRPGFTGGNMVSGTLVSISAESMTIREQDGSTKTVYYSSSTTVSKTTEGTVAELAAGDTVSANGTSNSDGSITATTIRLNPETPPMNANATQ